MTRSCSMLFATLAWLLTAAAHATTLKIAAIVPDGTTWMTAMRAGAAEIERRTEGRVVLKFYPGGVMGDGDAVLRKMRIGQLHGGAFASGTFADLVPDLQIYSLPFAFQSYDEVDYVRKQMDDSIAKGFEKHGLVALAISEGGFAQLMSRAPVRSVTDLQGKKIWALEDDKVSQAAWHIAGVAPVTLPLADVFTGLQTGLVDTVASPPVGAIAFQWHTALRYVTDVPLSYITGVLALDLRAWQKLSPADQAVLREVIGKVSHDLDAQTRASDRQAREALRGQGIEFVTPPQAELARWREIASQTVVALENDATYSRERIDELQGHLATYRSGAAAPRP